jgi:hypothetical protein
MLVDSEALLLLALLLAFLLVFLLALALGRALQRSASSEKQPGRGSLIESANPWCRAERGSSAGRAKGGGAV